MARPPPSSSDIVRRSAAPGAKRWLAAVAIGLALAAPAWAANYELDIEAPEELVQPLRERTLVGRWLDEPGFERDQLPLLVARAKEEAAAIVRAAGYFSAGIDVTLLETEPAAPQRVRIVVDAGARTTVNRMDLKLDGPPAVHKLREAIVDRWPLPDGAFFQSTAWEQGKRLLLDYLQQRGFVRARIVESRAEVDPVLTAASLSLHVDAGPRLAFGPMTVKGLERYDRSIVDALRQWTEASGDRADDGEPYDFDALLAFQARLRASGYFNSVDVLPDLAAVEADPQRTTVPVLVEVGERQTQRAMFGLGYGTDEGVRWLLGYEHRNLLGRGWQLESGVLWQSVRRRAFASARTPQKESGHYYQAGVRTERVDVQGELTDRHTVFAGQGKHAEDTEIFVSLQYQFEQRELPLGEPEIRRAFTLGYAWNRRRLDSQVDPRSGYSISAQLSGALRAIGSDRSFARMYTRAMRFWPMPRESALGDGLVIGMAELGYVLASSRDDIPSENLFRTGGTQSIRGYDYLSLGVPEAGAIVGGRILALASLEYQHPISRAWYGAAFADVGNASDRWVDYRAVWGYGVGVRWRSPVGPVSIDLAYGDRADKWRLHLAVGYAF